MVQSVPGVWLRALRLSSSGAEAMRLFRRLHRINSYWAISVITEKGIESLYLTDSELHRIRKRSRVAFTPQPAGFLNRLKFAWAILWQ